MTTLQQFKSQTGITSIQFMKSNNPDKKVQFATLPNGSNIYLSSRADVTKPLFVIVNDGTQKPELKGTLWVVNADVSAGAIL